jgi:pimeloyl-ACP methyl ester carboxylesterase
LTKAWISPEQWRENGEHFPHRSHRIFYRRSRPDRADQPALGSLANRPTLLLLHGFPTSSWDWSPLWETLTPQFHVIAPDLLGYGFSAKPADYEYSILDQANLCEALLSKLGVSEYHILAHDYGDTVAQELLARAHDDSAVSELKSICFLNGGLFPETHRARLVQRLLLSPLGGIVAKQMDITRFAKSMTSIFGAGTPPSRAELEAMWSMVVENNGVQVMHKLIGYIPERKQYRSRWVGALTNARTANIPLRLINGADDPVSGRHMAKRYADLVPGADIMLLNGIGHYPQIEAPQEVLRGVIGFHETRVVKHRSS